jgi:cysteine desulfurase
MTEQVTYLGVKSNGLVDLNELREVVRQGETSIVSIMGVNNEIGVVQPLKEIGEVRNNSKPCMLM